MTDLSTWLREALDGVARQADRDEPGCNCRDLGCHHTELSDLAGRTVQAHREILDRHAPDEDPDGSDEPAPLVCRHCVGKVLWYVQDLIREPWPCPDVRSLAAIYAETHPGFDPSWIKES
jgi:hypothetical protein